MMSTWDPVAKRFTISCTVTNSCDSVDLFLRNPCRVSVSILLVSKCFIKLLCMMCSSILHEMDVKFKFDFYMLGYQIVSLNDGNDTGYVYQCSGIYYVVVLCIFLINIYIFPLSSSLIDIFLPLLCTCALSHHFTNRNYSAILATLQITSYALVATSADSVPSSYLVRITIAPIGTTFGNLQ